MEEFFYILQKVKNCKISLEKDEENLLNCPKMFKKVCRLCLTEVEVLQPMDKTYKNVTYSTLVANILNVVMSNEPDQDFHNMICEECSSNLILFYKFREKIENNNETLTKLKSFIYQLKFPMKVEDEKKVLLESIQDDDDIQESIRAASVTTVSKLTCHKYATSMVESFRADSYNQAGEELKVEPSEGNEQQDEEVIEEEEEDMDQEICHEEFLDPVWCDDGIEMDTLTEFKPSSSTKHVASPVKSTSSRRLKHECSLCNEVFDSIKKLIKHMITHQNIDDEADAADQEEEEKEAEGTDVEFLDSVWCDDGTEVEMITEQRLEEMQSHSPLKSEHGSSVSGSQKKSPSPRRLNHFCSICNHAFDGPKKLARHMKTHDSSYRGRRFNKKPEDGQEIKAADGTTWSVPRAKKYNCPMCGLAIETPSKLKKHMEKHMKEMKPENMQVETNNKDGSYIIEYVCRVCKCAFPSAEYLATHEAQHDLKSRQYRRTEEMNTPKPPLLCELCGKNFLNRSSFILHLPQHTGEKPYKCELCDVRFTRKYHVKIHMRSHENVKPFSCEICGMTFTKSGNMYRHLAVHSSERNYPCELCGKAFKRKNDLPKHMICHTGERNFKCRVCDKTYTSRSGLVKHRKFHPDPDVRISNRILVVNQTEIPVYDSAVVYEELEADVEELTMLEK